ncbi:MAG: signal recognition particle-docking protein FtsY [Candidatus Atribacteria bacterium]|nr:signal recognition particle-docking protein FtsY [Candidatus Atribacteria bacterium]
MTILERLKKIINKPKYSIEEIEEFLISKNFGVEFTEKFIEKLETEQRNYIEIFKEIINETFSNVNPVVQISETPPTVFLFIGSNGSGKTTSIAKIANYYKHKGFKNILFIAGDTFRSGASEQLTIWADRLGAQIVKGQQNSDPASVIFDGLSKPEDYELILIDTSGRVETNDNLLKELTKIEKVIKNKTGKINEAFLVIDSLTGLNSFNQVKAFINAVGITGIILTKFDATTAPGVIVPIVQEYNIPVKFIGTGEDIKDIEEFKVETYIGKLLGG